MDFHLLQNLYEIDVKDFLSLSQILDSFCFSLRPKNRVWSLERRLAILLINTVHLIPKVHTRWTKGIPKMGGGFVIGAPKGFEREKNCKILWSFALFMFILNVWIKRDSRILRINLAKQLFWDRVNFYSLHGSLHLGLLEEFPWLIFNKIGKLVGKSTNTCPMVLNYYIYIDRGSLCNNLVTCAFLCKNLSLTPLVLQENKAKAKLFFTFSDIFYKHQLSS